MISSACSNLRDRLERAVSVDAPPAPSVLTVAAVALLYLAYAAKRYNGRHGAKELCTIRNALAPLIELYGHLHPSEITSLRLRAVRQYFISERNNCRATVQAKMERIDKCWQWLNDMEWFNWKLPTIGDIPYGHVRQKEKIQPVDPEVYYQTLKFLSPVAVVMLNAMLLTAMRPGEMCDLNSADLDMKKSPWTYRPRLHKTKHLDKPREIYIGPRAQLMLQSYIKLGYFFFTSRGNRYTPKLLHNAVMWACINHGISSWHPNQLRHSAGTLIRKEFSLDHAQAVLGHSRIETTQVYAERMQHLAMEAALRVG